MSLVSYLKPEPNARISSFPDGEIVLTKVKSSKCDVSMPLSEIFLKPPFIQNLL